MTMDVTTSFAGCLVDEWIRGGLTDAVVSPGSRSTPLALAFARSKRIRVHVYLDERSAGFLALGLGKARGVPAAVLCTSGTAAANLHPAVLEAYHGRAPLLVCTADRPWEMQEVGAGQTVDQAHLYGSAVRWFFDIGPPEVVENVGATWRALAARALAEAIGPPAGPVHLNLPFREPLVPTGAPLVEASGRPLDAAWSQVIRPQRLVTSNQLDALARWVGSSRKGALVVGWGAAVEPEPLHRFAEIVRWPVLADPLSGLRNGPTAISTYDALARIQPAASRLRPEVVLRLGAGLTSKHTSLWLSLVPTIHVDPDLTWSDPQRATLRVVQADPGLLLASLADRIQRNDHEQRSDHEAWLAEWMEAERLARSGLDRFLDSSTAIFEGRVARDVMGCLPEDSALVVASSMPVRDLELFAAPRRGVVVISNRGVNGIDGFVSTALGVATARREGRTVALLGDLALLHDSNGLIGARRSGIDLVLVVVDNDGGGIFSFLPQAELAEHFETLFGTPQGVDIEQLAAVYKIPVTPIKHADELTPSILDALARGGVRLLHVRSRRDENVIRHRLAFQAVADAVHGSVVEA